jgi:hypothetical protein
MKSKVAGHFADSLVMNKWSLVSVRRLMTSIGLVGPGLLLLIFMMVDNLTMAIVYSFENIFSLLKKKKLVFFL